MEDGTKMTNAAMAGYQDDESCDGW
jgi:hypothetical protein